MEPFKQHQGIVAPLERSNVDTDAIIPKQFLKSIKRTGFGDNLFDEMRYLDHGEPGQDCSQRPENPDFVLNQEPYRRASILLTGANFGCGSSREHAPWALKDFGFRVLIAPSFADIFYNNCFKNGLLPVVLPEDTVTELFAAKWTGAIHDEWTRNLLVERPGLAEAVQRTRTLMDRSVPDCLVEGYEPIIDGLSLPDPDDRHVLAAAICAGAQTIVTFNIRDFPSDALDPYGLEAIDPDTFVLQQADLHEGAIVATARDHRASLANPPTDVDTYLETLAAQGLVATADRLRDFAGVI